MDANTFLIEAVKRVIKQHEINVGHDLTASHRNMATFGLLRVNLALQVPLLEYYRP